MTMTSSMGQATNKDLIVKEKSQELKRLVILATSVS